MSGERLVFQPCSKKQQLILLDDSTDILLCGGGAGGGKALRHGEKVLTPKGFLNIENIKVGDEVIAPDNSIQKVVNVWPQGVVDIYKITFQDGRTVETCGEHLWNYHIAGKNIPKTGTTLELKAALDQHKGGRKYFPVIPLTSPIGGADIDLPVAPYVLGVLLGDGHVKATGQSTLTSLDQEIVDKVAKDCQISKGYGKSGTQAKAYNLSGLRDKLRQLGIAGTLSHTKFIPNEYFQASVHQKFALVQGLMDTDGYVTVCGKTYFDTTSEALAKGLTTILHSLGFSVKTTTKAGKYKKLDGEVVECKTVFRLYIRGAHQQDLFSLSRKKLRCKQKRVWLRVESVELVGKDYATCIEVSGSAHLFLTTNYVVTHNSHTCLTKALKYINDPKARVMIVRRSYPMLKLSGGLWDESKGIYRHFQGTPKVQTLTWVFPNGATIQFAAIPDDLSEWQGLQATNILVDEAAEFTQEEILFLMSRLRGAGYKGHLNVTMTCNPSRESFLYNWVEYSLDKETGIPLAGTEDVVRHFINIGGSLYWADSREELWEKYGKPMGLVDGKPGEKGVTFSPLTFRFIPLTVYDNPILLKNNPQYLANLLSQPRVNQLRYLHGSWTARAEGSGYFRREWVEIVDHPPAEVTARVRSWDFAASVPSESNPNPDWSAGVKLSRDKMGYYYVEHVNRFRKLSDGVLKEVIRTAQDMDGLDKCRVTIPRDPGAGGKAANGFQLRALAESGIYATSVPISTSSGKVARFLPFCTLAESGYVRVVRGDWNEAYLTELELFEGLRNQKDDQVDATSDAFNTISKSVTLPAISLPKLEQKSPIPRVGS